MPSAKCDCLPNVDEHDLLNVENLSQLQECGEPIIGMTSLCRKIHVKFANIEPT
jgi:hypothetical protein